MTSLAPISSENQSSVAQQNQRIRHSRDHNRCVIGTRRISVNIGSDDDVLYLASVNIVIYINDFENMTVVVCGRNLTIQKMNGVHSEQVYFIRSQRRGLVILLKLQTG